MIIRIIQNFEIVKLSNCKMCSLIMYLFITAYWAHFITTGEINYLSFFELQ